MGVKHLIGTPFYGLEYSQTLDKAGKSLPGTNTSSAYYEIP
jgi:hypothetical protein